MFKAIRRRAQAAQARVQSALQAFLLGGPVGLYIVIRQARLERRIRDLSTQMDMERDLHRRHIAGMRHLQNDLIGRQQALNITAIQFWNFCDRKAAEARQGGAS